MRIVHIVLTAVLGLTATTVSAQSFRAENRVIVTPQGDGLFAVETSSRYGARGAWCAAADYAMDRLGASSVARIYVRGPKASNSAPVVFGMDAGDTSPTGVFSTSTALRTAGSNLTVAHAFQFCYDSRLNSSRP